MIAANSYIKRGALTALCLLIASCALLPEDKETYLTPAEARAYVDTLVPNAASASKLPGMFESVEKNSSWIGTWNCNNRLVNALVSRLYIQEQTGNRFAGERIYAGDSRCNNLDTDKVEGKFSQQRLYMWFLNSSTRVNEYSYRQSDKALVFRGAWLYVNGKLTFREARDNPLYGVTGRKNPESGGPADMWESTELVPTPVQPRQTISKVYKNVMEDEDKSLSAYASELAGRQRERDAAEREDAQAARMQALAQIQRDLAAQASTRTQASAGLPLASVQSTKPKQASSNSTTQVAATTTRAASTNANSNPPPTSYRDSSDRSPVTTPVTNTAVSRKNVTFNGFIGKGVTRATSELAIADGIAQAKKDAQEWVASLGNGRFHAVITDARLVRCDAMGGNPLYRRCVLDITYEADDIP